MGELSNSVSNLSLDGQLTRRCTHTHTHTHSPYLCTVRAALANDHRHHHHWQCPASFRTLLWCIVCTYVPASQSTSQCSKWSQPAPLSFCKNSTATFYLVQVHWCPAAAAAAGGGGQQQQCWSTLRQTLKQTVEPTQLT